MGRIGADGVSIGPTHDGETVMNGAPLRSPWGVVVKVEWMQRVSEMGSAKFVHPQGLRQILQSKGVSGG